MARGVSVWAGIVGAACSCAAACGDAGSRIGTDASPDAVVPGGASDAALDGALDAGSRDAGSRDAGPGRDAAVDAGSAVASVRFVVLGDGGEGNQAQFDVARAMDAVCAQRGCDFALYLGDNIYSNGVSTVDDAQFVTKFEMPYEVLDFPFWVVLGNHDYGGSGLGIVVEWWKGPLEVEYTSRSDRWNMPAAYYDFVVEHVQFVGLDTTGIVHDQTYGEQAAWVEQLTRSSTVPWRIAFGHHPYVSNGKHGNAGHYDGLVWPAPASLRGTHLASFFDEQVCGRFDVYFAGHDHNRQWLGIECGTLHVLSGAASKTEALVHRDGNPVFYEDDTEVGFLWVEIAGDTLRAAFYDAAANVDYEAEIVRPSLGTR